jgi:DNA repair protein RadC
MPPSKARVKLSKYPAHVIERALLIAEAAMTTYEPTEKVLDSEDVIKICMPLIFGQITEHIIVLCVNRRQQLIAHKVISVGGQAAAIMEPRTIFRYAIQNNAAAIILVHNHPSGDPCASVEDITVTERISRLGTQLGIPLLDHVIVCDDGNFTSMLDRGQMSAARFGLPPATGPLGG